MSQYLEKAKEIRAIKEPHYNCTQSVLLTFAEKLNLSEETAYKIAAAFGSGMKSGITCGVIAGALMVLGLAGVDDVPTTQKVIKDFKEKHENMIDCAELLHSNAEKGGQRKPHCDKLVFEMVQYIENILKEKNKI